MQTLKTILLACPVSDFKAYILPKWIQHIKKLTVPPGYSLDFLLIDNSVNVQFSRAIKKTKINVFHLPPYKNERINDTITRCTNEIVKYLQYNGFDYWFSLECDVFPPLNIIERLLSHNKPVVSACYNISFNNNRHLMVQYPFKTGDDTVDIKGVTPMEGFKAITGQLEKVFGCGMGCLLIEKDVVSGYEFHVDPALKVHADTFFHIDIHEKGIYAWLDTAVFCRHYNSRWSVIERMYERKRQL